MHSNELNSVEHYIIHQLTGVNLNQGIVSESQSSYEEQWKYSLAMLILIKNKVNKTKYSSPAL